MGREVPPELLDCTIRDGSYAIDFKFTAADTALIAGSLEQIGLGWIEVGHGLGLGASEAGKGVAASHDLDVIEATRARVRAAKIGAFFIPGIGTKQHLRAAADAGLDFVRVGQNADAIAEAMPYVELARSLGLQPFVNFMKTYGISPAEFAAGAQQSEAAGAIGVYAVDSAGGMVPGEVREYVEAARGAASIPVGFHGHSNLHLAVANSLAAWEAGATWIDTSLYGIGRSSGNVPTEVMVAVLSRLGVDCGIDPSDAIDVAERYLRPFAEHLHPHDMVAVSLGLGQFHSSFLPRALAAADEAGINPFRLIVELGRRNVMELPDELLTEVVDELRDRAPVEVRRELAAFADPRFGPRTISNRSGAVSDLLDSLEVVAAKRRLAIVLDLVHVAALGEGAVAAEFVLEDEFMALGRIRYGSTEALAAAMAPHGARIALALVEGGASFAAPLAGLGPALFPYRAAELELEYLGDVALVQAAARGVGIQLVDPGWYPRADVDRLAARVGTGVGIRVVAGPPGTARDEYGELLAADLFIGSPPWTGREAGSGLVLDRDEAFRGRLPHWLAVTRAAAARSTEQHPA